MLGNRLGLYGSRETLVTACSSGAAALAVASDLVATASADVVLAGGADALTRICYLGFNALKLLDPEPCRPFDRHRRGMSIGEGAGFLVLEDVMHARARGARIYAELAGYGMTTDAYHVTSPDPDGEGMARAMREALERAGLAAGEVGYANAHGTATSQNDRIEARALRDRLRRGGTAGLLDEVDDRPYDGGGREPGSDGGGARPRAWRDSAHRAPGRTRSRGRLRLRAPPRAPDRRRARDLELVRFRGSERDPALAPDPCMTERDARCRVAITGIGVVDSALSGGSAALGAYLACPRSDPGQLASGALTGAVTGVDVRRLSRVCQLAVAAARLAVTDAACPSDEPLGLVLGTEFGDLRSTHEFADGYLTRGQAGLSALLFPNTVMNTMAAATAIALGARALSLTINAPTLAGELAIARATVCIASGRAQRLLAGGVDEIDPFVGEVLRRLGADLGVRGEGAGFLVLESWEAARARGARILGEIRAAVSGALPARPHGIGRVRRSPAVAQALAHAGLDPSKIGCVYASANGDRLRDNWESALLAESLAPHRPPASALSMLTGHHAGMGAVRVGAAAWTARSGLFPVVSPNAASAATEIRRVSTTAGLVHSVARGGSQVAIVVGPPPPA